MCMDSGMAGTSGGSALVPHALVKVLAVGRPALKSQRCCTPGSVKSTRLCMEPQQACTLAPAKLLVRITCGTLCLVTDVSTFLLTKSDLTHVLDQQAVGSVHADLVPFSAGSTCTTHMRALLLVLRAEHCKALRTKSL